MRMTRPQSMQAGIGAHHMVKLVCPATSMVVPIEVLRLLQHSHISLQRHQVVSGDAALGITAFSPECCRTCLAAFQSSTMLIKRVSSFSLTRKRAFHHHVLTLGLWLQQAAIPGSNPSNA